MSDPEYMTHYWKRTVREGGIKPAAHPFQILLYIERRAVNVCACCYRGGEGERRGGIRARVLGYGEVYCWIGGGGGGGLSASGIGKGGPQLHLSKGGQKVNRLGSVPLPLPS